VIITGEKTSAPTQRVCAAEHAGWLSTPMRKVINNPKRILRGLVGAGETVVDLGCGPGFFSLPLAHMVGDAGRVIAVDVQEAMLKKLTVRAEKAGLASRIRPHRSNADSIGTIEPADFVLAFYVLHEVPDKESFLRQVHDILKEGGRFLLVEPIGHVTKAEYRRTVETAHEAGLVSVSVPRIAFSRAALFTRR
jgi:ubiquinone/menaquinone biosynthesis C-methylase UbiE